jgi:hypothetical protein
VRKSRSKLRTLKRYLSRKENDRIRSDHISARSWHNEPKRAGNRAKRELHPALKTVIDRLKIHDLPATIRVFIRGEGVPVERENRLRGVASKQQLYWSQGSQCVANPPCLTGP